MYFDARTLNLAEFNVISAPFELKFSTKICVYTKLVHRPCNLVRNVDPVYCVLS